MKEIKHSMTPPRSVINEEVSQEDPGEELIKLLEDKEEALSVV